MTPPDFPLDLLVVATHPDDAEISVGGTILKAVSQGFKVGIVDLTTGEPTPRGTPERRQKETEAATQTLGVSWRHQLNLPNRKLEPTLSARRSLAAVFRQVLPKMILAPWGVDVHPDHVAASSLADGARFWAKLSRTDLPGNPYYPPRMYYYWSIHLRLPEQPSFVVDVSDFIEQKMQAINCYASQMSEGRDATFPTVLDDIRARARYWGWAIGKGYGEPLLSREQLGIDNLHSLL